VFEEILSKIASSLRKRNIPHMIIGGQAVLLYGEPRLTRDIDITLGVNIDHIGEVLAAAAEAALKPIPEDIGSFVRQTMVLPLIDEPSGIRVDLIFSFTPYETQAIGRAKRVLILGEEVHFASPEDLIIHKIFAGRPRDLEDARIVLLKNPDIDNTYIRGWLVEFDAVSDEKKFLRTFEEILKG